MAAAPSYAFANNALYPVYNDRDAHNLPVNLAAGTYERGTILGQVTTAGVNDVQTITIGGSPTGGTFTITATPTTPYAGTPAVVLTEAYNASLATVQADLESIFGPGNVVVTGTAGASYVVTFTGSQAITPETIMVTSGAGLTGGTSPSATIAHTTTGVAATGTYAAYASGNSDGTQLPKAILMYPCVVTNVGGVLQIVQTNAGGSAEVPGYFQLSTTAYFHGSFRCQELVGLDANAVTKLAGTIITGNSSAGIFSF